MPGKLKVLVVDDVEMNRIILSELFSGWTVPGGIPSAGG